MLWDFFELQEALAINILKFCNIKITSNSYQSKLNFEAKWGRFLLSFLLV
nr:MAG TPA: hypothetical protein [Caudoviricetes sp.]